MSLAPAVAAAKTAAPSGFLEKFTVLKTAPRELWVVFGLKVLESISYSLMNMILVLFLSKDLKMSDLGAGSYIAAWSTGVTACTLVVGALADAIGVRKTFLIGFAVCFLSRATMAFSPSTWFAATFGLVPLAVGVAMMIPVMTGAIKLFTTGPQRSIAFSLFYSLMNLGYWIGFKRLGYLRDLFDERGPVSFLGFELTTFRLLFLIAAAISLVGFVLNYLFLRDGVRMTDEGVVIDPPKKSVGGLGAAWAGVKKAGVDTLGNFKALAKEATFWRFLAFVFILVGVRLVFYHMSYTFPKYLEREIGTKADFAGIWSINTAMCIFLVPLVGALSQNISSYRMIVVGTTMSALPVLLLTLPIDSFAFLSGGAFEQSLAWYLGKEGSLHTIYLSTTFFVLIFSLGEAVWSPRLYEYTASVAPPGKAASYMGLSLLPFFLSKLIAGPLSGFLLQTYCPETGPRNSAMLWLVIAVWAMSSPVLIVALRRFLKPTDHAPASAA